MQGEDIYDVYMSSLFIHISSSGGHVITPAFHLVIMVNSIKSLIIYCGSRFGCNYSPCQATSTFDNWLAYSQTKLYYGEGLSVRKRNHKNDYIWALTLLTTKSHLK